MTLTEYMEALRAVGNIENPTVEQMLSVCPHLTEQEALAGLMHDDVGGRIALPPVKILGSYQTAEYYSGCFVETPTPAFTCGQFSYRTPRSYADGQPHGDRFSHYRFSDQAMAYAEQHWPKALIQDTWVDLVEIHVQDPTDLTEGLVGGPLTNFVTTVGLSRTWNDIVCDHSKPRTELWNDAIIVMSIDPIVSSEIKGQRPSVRGYNCARCGAGLDLTACSGCGTQYPDDGSRCGWSTPLPPKLIKLLRDSGHTFTLDPERLPTK